MEDTSGFGGPVTSAPVTGGISPPALLASAMVMPLARKMKMMKKMEVVDLVWITPLANTAADVLKDFLGIQLMEESARGVSVMGKEVAVIIEQETVSALPKGLQATTVKSATPRTIILATQSTRAASMTWQSITSSPSTSPSQRINTTRP